MNLANRINGTAATAAAVALYTKCKLSYEYSSKGKLD